MRSLILLVSLACSNAMANQLEGETPSMPIADMIVICVVSYACGWMSYKVAEATNRFTPGTEALIAVAAGLFIGPLVAVLLLR